MVDTTAPKIDCVADKTVECPATPEFDDPTVSDLCDAAPVVTPVDTEDLSDRARRVHPHMDGDGQLRQQGQLLQTITVVDTTAPKIDCVADKTVECPATPEVDAPTVSDLCDAAPVVTPVDTEA